MKIITSIASWNPAFGLIELACIPKGLISSANGSIGYKDGVHIYLWKLLREDKFEMNHKTNKFECELCFHLHPNTLDEYGPNHCGLILTEIKLLKKIFPRKITSDGVKFSKRKLQRNIFLRKMIINIIEFFKRKLRK